MSSQYSVFFFFFSSRRRHTRFDCDWSSDVCSSDLDDLADFLDRAAMRHQFGARGHVDAVDVGMAHRRRCRGQVDLDGTGITRHLHDFLGGGAAHDGVIHQQHLAALELAADGVELLAHRFLARGLARHDEDRKSTRLNSSHSQISYAVFCLKKKKIVYYTTETTVRGQKKSGQGIEIYGY